MIKKLITSLFIFFSACNYSFAQVTVTHDELPDTSSTDSKASLNNQLRQSQNAINSIGSYFNSNGYLSEANGGTGTNLSAFANGSILIQNGANVGIGTFGQGNSGQIVISAGAGLSPNWGNFHGASQVFLSSGSFTAPSGVTKIYLSMIGGGGNGAIGGTTGGGGGGGAGQCIINYPYTVVAGNSYTVTINGGHATTIFDTITLAAGNNGSAGSGTTAGAGGISAGQPSSSTGGSIGLYLSPGGTPPNSGSIGGGGAGTPFGAGANGNAGGAGSDAAANTGAGGSGSDTSTHSGGAGGSGIVVVQY